MSAGKGDRNRSIGRAYWESGYWARGSAVNAGDHVPDDSGDDKDKNPCDEIDHGFDNQDTVHGQSEQCSNIEFGGGLYPERSGDAEKSGDGCGAGESAAHRAYRGEF